jgi:hypothetical protein
MNDHLRACRGAFQSALYERVEPESLLRLVVDRFAPLRFEDDVLFLGDFFTFVFVDFVTGSLAETR